MKNRRLGAAAALLVIAAAAAGVPPAQAADAARGAVYTVSDGKGEIRLLWFPAPESWPALWRLEDAGSGAVLAERIGPGDAAALAKLSAEDAAAVREFDDYLAEGPEARRLGAFVFLLKASTNWDFARALGVGRVLEKVPPGPRSYRLAGLDRDGKPTGLALVSRPVDSAVATPLPPPPVDLEAAVVTAGISLGWSPPDTKGGLPIVAYLVFRDGGGETNRLLTSRPLAVTPRSEASRPAFLDPDAPRGADLTYRVLGVDPFGRRGEAAPVEAVYTDPRATLAPLLKATAKEDRADLSWDPGRKSDRAGFLIERGYLHDGPFELLTEKMLKPDADGYRDQGLVPGTYYFYRIRSVGPDGDVGEPSPAMRVRAGGGGRLPKPEGLEAETGRLGVRLKWRQPEERVEGFIVERWSEFSGKWARLTARSIPKSSYDDVFPPQSSGTFRYRVRAVGHDHREGDSGKEIEVTLPDTLGPRPPQITQIEGVEGRVALRFAPSPDPEDVDRVYVVRADDPDTEGFVIGDALPAKATEFTDTGVRPGRRYWYRLVAFDKRENRGDLSAAVSVVVSSPPVPAPKAPSLKYRSKPLALVEIGFKQPPKGLGVLVQRRAPGGPWLTVAGPVQGVATLVDPGPPAGARLAYRLLLQAEDGGLGEPSEAVEITVP